VIILDEYDVTYWLVNVPLVSKSILSVNS